MAGTRISLRIPPELAAELDALAERASKRGLRASRSMVARTILVNALAEDPKQAVVAETVALVNRVVFWAVGTISKEFHDQLPERIKQGMNSLVDGNGLQSDDG